MNKELELKDKNYFYIFIGNRVLKKDVFQSEYFIPVYSANVFKPFGYLKDSNITDFSRSYLIWGIDGKFEFNLMPKGTVFATTDHCGAIKIIHEDILPEYVLYELRLQALQLGFDRGLRSSLKNMEQIVISVPIKADGSFDREKQKEIANKHDRIWKIKEIIGDKIAEIGEINVNINIQDKDKTVVMSELFDFPETNSGVTKEFCERNKGNIPVYGCSKSDISVLGYIKNNLADIKYYEDALAWNRNGSVGHVFYRKGRFTTNEDHRVLQLKPEFNDQIDLFFVRFALENEIKKLGFGFTNKLGKSKMQDIEIQIPIKTSGSETTFDIKAQKKLSGQYQSVYSIKAGLMDKLRSLEQVICQVN